MPSDVPVVALPLDLAPYVTALRTAAGTDIAAGGICDGGPQMTLTTLVGNRSDRLKFLDVRRGQGLGGKALALSRPIWVADYWTAKGITHHYDEPVRAEGLRAMVAVPFSLPDGVQGVLYASNRKAMVMGDRVLDRVVDVTRRLETDARVSAEVERRLADLNPGSALHPGRRDQCLRDAHAELMLLRDDVAAAHRDRVDALLTRIAHAMSPDPTAPPPVRLTRRELDVLIQVATGASNAEVAERLGLTEATTKSYLQTASRKLDAGNRVESVANARRLGLLP
ncbi:hypothetical protein GCM10009547_38170 [Sporichthya brevicatena]|uniref:HTH luxR-type domain-containing protein n=1 Tax=Sporichthya brevicatena TaxID=171442 RepID=A0ABN1H6V9_9ACTN